MHNTRLTVFLLLWTVYTIPTILFGNYIELTIQLPVYYEVDNAQHYNNAYSQLSNITNAYTQDAIHLKLTAHEPSSTYASWFNLHAQQISAIPVVLSEQEETFLKFFCQVVDNLYIVSLTIDTLQCPLISHILRKCRFSHLQALAFDIHDISISTLFTNDLITFINNHTTVTTLQIAQSVDNQNIASLRKIFDGDATVYNIFDALDHPSLTTTHINNLYIKEIPPYITSLLHACVTNLLCKFSHITTLSYAGNNHCFYADSLQLVAYRHVGWGLPTTIQQNKTPFFQHLDIASKIELATILQTHFPYEKHTTWAQDLLNNLIGIYHE